jgi:hypothetical protein
MSVTFEDKIALSEKLGLKNQSGIIKTTVTIQDIEAEVRGEFCRQITFEEAEDILGVTAHNDKITRNTLLLAIIPVVLFIGTVIMAIKAPSASGLELLGVLSSVFVPIILGCIIGSYVSNNAAYVRTEWVKETNVEIPYGGMLKLKEAIDKDIFQGFMVLFPEINRDRKLRDPILAGIIYDNDQSKRYYMLYAWDMDKDRDRLEHGTKR